MYTRQSVVLLGFLMIVFGSRIHSSFAQARNTACGDRMVAIIVEPALLSGIRDGLTQFETDLCASGYNTVERSSEFADPPAVRTYLRDLYWQSKGIMAGAILIGNVPYAYQWVVGHSTNPSIPDTEEEAISFQYYADLNGTFAKSDAYNPPHTYSYDLHEGNIEWEIWIGVLPRYNGDLQQTVAALNRYFAKNHAYRTGVLQRPPVFLEVNELQTATTLAEYESLMEGMRSGIYSWTPYSSSEDARLYFNSPPTGLTVEQGYADMQNGLADFMVQGSHGYYLAAGQLTITVVESNPLRTLFFWSSGCSIGNLDYTPNVLASILYSTTSDVLVAKGTTNNSGGMGNNLNGYYGHNIATALAAGEAFGDALVTHVNVPLIWPWSTGREFHLATSVILGDPTLRHRGDNLFEPKLTVATTSFRYGTLNAPYTAVLRAADGTPPYIWSVIEGVLPAGLELNSATGAISGTPTESGDVIFTICLEDANHDVAFRPLSITVHEYMSFWIPGRRRSRRVHVR